MLFMKDVLEIETREVGFTIGANAMERFYSNELSSPRSSPMLRRNLVSSGYYQTVRPTASHPP